MREDFSGPDAGMGQGSSLGSATTYSTEPAQLKNHGLTKDQIEKLLSLIDTPKAGFKKSEGTVSSMLDSGASCHMAGDVSMMDKVERIAPVAIGLPNGRHIVASEKGSVALGGGLKLENVLCVPKLNCNLVSISKLCKQLNYAVMYFDDFCVIQDRTSRTLIGSGEQRDRVYYYKDTRPRQANAVNEDVCGIGALGIPQVRFYLSFLVV